ncbi:MAG: hypothetical protein P8P74_13415 [Crocinitomicaceae bacterium]|nr:hypothetical protein [Crocinitomicaceae bacterium]
MRFIYFLLITLILSACGHQKIRFSKVKRTQKVVEISEIPSLKEQTETATVRQAEVEKTQPENTSVSTETSEADQSVEESITTYELETIGDFPNTVEDSTTITEEEAAYIRDEAIRAEKLGTWSFITSIASPITFILAVVIFAFAVFGGGGTFGAILSIVLGISVLVFMVLSYIFGIASLRAPYNTARGRKFAIAGLIISSCALALLLANILFGIL